MTRQTTEYLKKNPPSECWKSSPHTRESSYVAAWLAVGWFYFGLFVTQNEG